MTAAWLVAIVVSLLVVAGALFCCLAALGMVRFPDLFTRMHAASKAGLVGGGLILAGFAVAGGDGATWIKVAGTLVFFAMTSPLSAHLLAKAARQASQPIDNLDGQDGPGRS